MSDFLKVYEVGPRDGLQNEAVLVSTKDKQNLIDSLVKAGLRSIEGSDYLEKIYCKYQRVIPDKTQ